jgi:hypothetical protein
MHSGTQVLGQSEMLAKAGSLNSSRKLLVRLYGSERNSSRRD